MTNGKNAAGYVLQGWEIHSGSGTRVSEAFVWLKTPDGKSLPHTSAKDVSPIMALCKAVQKFLPPSSVRIVEQVVLDQGEEPSANMVVMVAGVLGAATVRGPNILDASVRAFVDAINNAMAAQPVVMVA
ncbi:MAG: hypothetical protein Q8O97_00510 [bacterium]|nr:hypothetical protein [Candidatus Wildermuthbacteria bacterium]MDP2664443.1 hypothetical protein [bacterium]